MSRAKQMVFFSVFVTAAICVMVASIAWIKEGWRLSGYDTKEQMEAAKAGGFPDKVTYLAAQAAGLNTVGEWEKFSSDMSEAGFENLPEFVAFRKREKAKKEEAERIKREIAKRNSCAYNWEKCTDNKQLINEYKKWTSELIEVQCQLTINKLTRFGDPDWRLGYDFRKLFGIIFSGNSYVKSGIVHVIHDEVRIPNAFGGMVRSEAHCIYDLKNERIVNAFVES